MVPIVAGLLGRVGVLRFDTSKTAVERPCRGGPHQGISYSTLVIVLLHVLQ